MNIWHGNTLTGAEIYGGLFQDAPTLFDVVLTNPPFGGKEGKDAQSRFAYKTSATQVLFLQHVIDSLKPNGRCGIVLDDGVLFRTNETAFVQTKRKLLNECDVWCIGGITAAIRVTLALFHEDELRRRLVITLMKPWYTGKPYAPTKKSHVNFCVYASTWKASHAFALDESEVVAAWVKNDHIGFEIPYLYQGVVRKYRPDFLVRLANGEMLILETKGEESEQDVVKHRALDEWVRAVNAHGGFDRWHWAVARCPSEIGDVLARVQTASTT
ncbi:MAG: N-6 DNA methylase [Gloeomargarita sp. HHBFW_bins_205]